MSGEDPPDKSNTNSIEKSQLVGKKDAARSYPSTDEAESGGATSMTKENRKSRSSVSQVKFNEPLNNYDDLESKYEELMGKESEEKSSRIITEILPVSDDGGVESVNNLGGILATTQSWQADDFPNKPKPGEEHNIPIESLPVSHVAEVPITLPDIPVTLDNQNGEASSNAVPQDPVMPAVESSPAVAPNVGPEPIHPSNLEFGVPSAEANMSPPPSHTHVAIPSSHAQRTTPTPAQSEVDMTSPVETVDMAHAASNIYVDSRPVSNMYMETAPASNMYMESHPASNVYMDSHPASNVDVTHVTHPAYREDMNHQVSNGGITTIPASTNEEITTAISKVEMPAPVTKEDVTTPSAEFELISGLLSNDGVMSAAPISSQTARNFETVTKHTFLDRENSIPESNNTSNAPMNLLHNADANGINFEDDDQAIGESDPYGAFEITPEEIFNEIKVAHKEQTESQGAQNLNSYIISKSFSSENVVVLLNLRRMKDGEWVLDKTIAQGLPAQTYGGVVSIDEYGFVEKTPSPSDHRVAVATSARPSSHAVIRPSLPSVPLGENEANILDILKKMQDYVDNVNHEIDAARNVVKNAPLCRDNQACSSNDADKKFDELPLTDQMMKMLRVFIDEPSCCNLCDDLERERDSNFSITTNSITYAAIAYWLRSLLGDIASFCGIKIPFLSFLPGMGNVTSSVILSQSIALLESAAQSNLLEKLNSSRLIHIGQNVASTSSAGAPGANELMQSGNEPLSSAASMRPDFSVNLEGHGSTLEDEEALAGAGTLELNIESKVELEEFLHNELGKSHKKETKHDKIQDAVNLQVASEDNGTSHIKHQQQQHPSSQSQLSAVSGLTIGTGGSSGYVADDELSRIEINHTTGHQANDGVTHMGKILRSKEANRINHDNHRTAQFTSVFNQHPSDADVESTESSTEDTNQGSPN